MKLKHTQAKKARRKSSFRHEGMYGAPSKKRIDKRMALQPSRKFRKAFGYQVVRIQRIYLKKHRFHSPIYKYVEHTAERAQG